MKNWIKDKYVVLTGASGGIGRELAKLLVQKYGAKVIGIARREDKMQSLKKELGEAFTYRLFDVGQRETWKSFKEWLLKENISPSLLINNAGVFPTFQKALSYEEDTAEWIMRTNYFSIVYATETLGEMLLGDKKNKPSIVNIASSAALCTVAGTSAYSASKAAIKGYTEALQLEEKGKKYVGIIYPGTTATELFRSDENTKNSALDLVAMPAKKMAKKIARKILRRKKRAVLGWDAKLMHWTAKFMPVKGPAIIAWVMKSSKSKVFKNVYDCKK